MQFALKDIGALQRHRWAERDLSGLKVGFRLVGSKTDSVSK